MRPRKSAGTHGFLEVVRHTMGGPPGDPSGDREYVRSGGAVVVPAFRRSGGQLRRGRLEVSQASVSWRPRFRGAVAVSGPYQLLGVGFINSAAVKSHMFRMVSVSAAGETWDFAVPMTDVPLVSEAFGG